MPPAPMHPQDITAAMQARILAEQRLGLGVPQPFPYGQPVAQHDLGYGSMRDAGMASIDAIRDQKVPQYRAREQAAQQLARDQAVVQQLARDQAMAQQLAFRQQPHS